ncbi:MAG: patatin-like phospholipase family protein [Pseudomonadota bacterium]|nr:patatin-like phospholipase family protein [Pseudomonadota bacterium]
MSVRRNPRSTQTALVLTGGGARAAYQVGVLRAIAEMLPRGAPTPFQIICGTSAGAINASAVASNAGDFRCAVRRLVSVWRNFHASDVYRTDVAGMARCAWRWFLALLVGGIRDTNPVSLLDNAPLGELLTRHHDSASVDRALAAGTLRAFAVTASGYNSGHSICFFHGVRGIDEWQRMRRVGIASRVEVGHLMASSAIPFMFPPIRLGSEYFGDGSMRQTAPISPALHLGADRILVVSVSGRANNDVVRTNGCPSLAHIAGHALNSLFTDGLEADLERLDRTNQTLAKIPPAAVAGGINLKHVECMVLSPSKPLDQIAARHVRALPWTVRYFLRGMGAMRRSGGNLASYVLFERSFCRALMHLGYHDTVARRAEIAEFLALETATPVRNHRARTQKPDRMEAAPERIAA